MREARREFARRLPKAGRVRRWMEGNLAAEGGHGAGGAVVVGELVGLGFVGDGAGEERFEGGVGRGGGEGGLEVEFAVAAEAGAEFAVGGEAELVAARAEVGGGDGSDEAEVRAGGPSVA